MNARRMNGDPITVDLRQALHIILSDLEHVKRRINDLEVEVKATKRLLKVLVSLFTVLVGTIVAVLAG